MRRLVATADVVAVVNLPHWKPLPAMKLDYDSLKAVKPDIILTMVTAYGRGGPYSERVGFDGIGQAMSGAVYMTSDGDGERPYRFQAPWVDFTTALHCAYGTVLALMARQKTGLGQVVEGALLGAALTVGNGLLIEQSVLDINRKPTGNRGQTAGPVDIFKTRDGWILVQVVGDPLFRRWAKLMGEDHWLTDPRFKDDISRGDNGGVISERMGRWCAERTSSEALEVLGQAMIPAGAVLKPQQTLDDPHVRMMNFFQSVDYPGLPRPARLAWGSDDGVGNARIHPPARAHLGGAHRRYPRRDRLRRGGHRRPARRRDHLKVNSQHLQTIVETLRTHGVSWSAIAGRLGVSRQTAWERFT